MSNETTTTEWRVIAKKERPKYPLDILPENIRNLILQYHDASGCPIDYPACVIMSVVSSAVYDRFRISAKFDRDIPLNLYQFAIGESGDMKSPPFKFFSRRLQILTRDANKVITEHNNQLAEEIKKRKKKMEKADDGEKETLLKEIAALKDQERPYYPFIVTDPTLEALAITAQKSNECVTVIAGEANVVNVISGLSYNPKGNAPNINIVLSGFDGEYVCITRVGKNDIRLYEPLVSICVAGQRITLETLTKVGEQVERGFPNRCLFYYPEPEFGHDATTEKPIDQNLLTAWDNLVTDLYKTDRNGHPYISMTEEAMHQHDLFRNKCDQLAKRSRYAGQIKAWIRKQQDITVRVAAILLLMSDPKARVITEEVFLKAVRYFEEYAFPMALIAYGITGDELTNEQARYIANIRSIQKKEGRCTVARLKNAMHTKDQRAFNETLAYLREYDYIRLVQAEKSHKTSLVIAINPNYTE